MITYDVRYVTTAPRRATMAQSTPRDKGVTPQNEGVTPQNEDVTPQNEGVTPIDLHV